MSEDSASLELIQHLFYFCPEAGGKTGATGRSKDRGKQKQIKTGAVVLMRESALECGDGRGGRPILRRGGCTLSESSAACPTPCLGCLRVVRVEWGGGCSSELKSLGGSRADKDTAAACSIDHQTALGKCSPGPSPVTQERPGRSTARLHAPPLHQLRPHSLRSHA